MSLAFVSDSLVDSSRVASLGSFWQEGTAAQVQGKEEASDGKENTGLLRVRV